MAATQTAAPAASLTVTTPLGSNVSIQSLTAQEGISTPFDYQVVLSIPNKQQGVFDALLNQPMTVTIATPGAGGRRFNGVCVQLIEAARSAGHTTFIASLAPSFWSLTKRVNSRIFQNVSVPDILKSLLPPATPIFVLLSAYPPRQFCVQYRESDFDFVSRLMEEEGIYYYFDHTASGHTMVIADTSTRASTTPGPSPVPFGQPGLGQVSSWSKAQRLTAGQATEDDFNFQFPTVNLVSTATIMPTVQAGTVTHSLDIGNSGVEHYDFPGGFAQWSDADPAVAVAQSKRLAQVRMEEVAAAALYVDGASGCPGFTPGHALALAGHPDANGRWLIRRTSHAGFQNAGSALQYGNTFSAIPIALPFRPARVTPRPVIAGPQSGFVVGPPGQTVYTDKYGRVKVQFHWDRQGKSDDKSSCWVRVGATLSGDTTVPPIGREVLVAFEEGDPDRPIIVGSARSPSFPPGP
jgi:type VI secretion system secreted protein VgrG